MRVHARRFSQEKKSCVFLIFFRFWERIVLVVYEISYVLIPCNVLCIVLESGCAEPFLGLNGCEFYPRRLWPGLL
jgi:hypothetical protein